MELYHPLPGGRARCKLLPFALCGSCSLNAFQAALEDEKNKIDGIPSPAPELRCPLSSAPSGEAINYFCLHQTLQTFPVHTRPNPSGAARGGVGVSPGLYSSLGPCSGNGYWILCAPALFLPRKGGKLRQQSPHFLWFVVYGNT